jgi:hypothetical protein
MAVSEQEAVETGSTGASGARPQAASWVREGEPPASPLQ